MSNLPPEQMTATVVSDPLGYPFIVSCKFCKGSGAVPDVSKWPPQAVCPGCKGAGVHVLETRS